ncbi:helix-turn-helix transcriptional regulator [Thermoactinomyces mirandus]|uniref:PAS domain-containing protein n=1 Tax=Thermoactinomyces mirandus TaxID=2756294 RepID=A0A7W2ASD8_9BACL|nr:PAS domain-containing protein [Thermoactinomyces mirandus]MBA4602376.1 PAS domain-containing protein [Thermoactinomyces mirandus]
MFIQLAEDLNPVFEPYLPFMKAITGILGDQCEVVLHDFSNYNASVVAIVGNVTNRKLYAPLTNFVIEIIKTEGDEAEDRIGYHTYFKGKPYRCSTIFIRHKRKLAGCLCINYCIQDFFTLRKIAGNFIMEESGLDKSPDYRDEYFASNIDDFVKNVFQKVIEKRGEDLTRLTRAERLEIIRELEEKGIFLVKGTVEMLAEHMNLSKYTVYNYIDEVKSNKEMKDR